MSQCNLCYGSNEELGSSMASNWYVKPLLHICDFFNWPLLHYYNFD